VIAWAPEDNPTDGQIKQVLDDFERVAFSGLSPDRVAYSAILHREDNGACHIHIFVARVDLQTGKSLNIAPPGWEKTFDPLRDYYNHMHAWARPDDPARARNLQPRHVALIEAADLRRGIQVEPDTKALITQYLEQRIEAGLIKDRAGVIDALKDAGFQINRAGKNYISIKDTEGNKLRLKGAIYEEHFTPSRAIEIADSTRTRSNRKADKRRAEEARRELEKAIKRRAEYNEKRYQIREQTAPEINQGDKRVDRSAHQQTAQNAFDHDVMAAPADSNAVQPDRADDMDMAANSIIQRKNRDMDIEQRAKSDSHYQQGLDNLHGQQAASVSVSHQTTESSASGVASNDRNRTFIIGLIKEIERGISAARNVFDRAIKRCREALRSYDRELSNLARADEEFVNASQELERGHTKMIENRADELEIFKSQISLTEYAISACGYVLDRRESSKNCHVLRSLADNDKIIVTRAQDGHDVYFSVRDDNDNGSIIDFVQRRRGLNLGKVRKELRPWAGLAEPVESMKRRKPTERIERPQPVERDRAKLIAAYHKLQPYGGDYLETERKLRPATIAAFAQVIRQDQRGNVCFIHRDASGEVSGWEIKNRGFSGFSSGGSKALAMHMPDPDDDSVRRVVVTESMIDAMSYYQVNGRAGDLYVSFAGSMSDAQAEQLRDIVLKAPAVVVATDNDQQGHKYAALLQQWRPDATIDIPSSEDWNEELRKRALKREQGPSRSWSSGPSLG
jgi:hypothetical protein